MDITAHSPVSALWDGGAGGLAGRRAMARLAAASPPVVTVMDLCAATPARITAIPRAGAGVLAEVRRALAASGLALAGEPAPSPAQAARAAAAGDALARRAASRASHVPAGKLPAGAQDFAALVTDLRGELAGAAQADPERRRRLLAVPRLETPRALAGRPWAWESVGLRDAAQVTGYAAATLRRRIADAARDRAAGTVTPRTMPEPRGGQWVIADLAVWAATASEGHAAGGRGGKIGAREAQRIAAQVQAARVPDARWPGGRLPYGETARIAATFGVDPSLVRKIAGGTVPAGGGGGAPAARARRRDSELIPAVRAAAEAVAARDGRITYRALAREMGVDYAAAVHRAALAGIRSGAAAEQAGDGAVSALIAAVIAAADRRPADTQLLAACHQAGLPATLPQVRRLAPGVRGEQMRRDWQPAGAQRARGESLHPRGWLSPAQVAEDWGTTAQAVHKAVQRGVIAAVREDGHVWIDPGRLRAARGSRATPVDRDHPRAIPAQGDPGFAG